MTDLVIGVDIGGTRTKSGLVNIHTGEVRNLIMHPTEKENEVHFLNQLGSAISKHQAFAGQSASLVAGIGIGVSSFVNGAGVVDSTYGFLKFMEDYPMKAIIEKEFHLPCLIDNDARVVALGEALYGRGKGFERVLVLTLGTGVGVGFVKQGRFDETLPYAHMAGHMSIGQTDFTCYCGKQGCLESLVSATGILDAANRLNWVQQYPGIPLSVENIFKAEQEGNEDAFTIVSAFLTHLKTGISNYINLFAPGIIIIGGGVSRGLKPYLNRLKENQYLKPFKSYQVEIELSELDEYSGILGSAALFNE